VIVRFFDLETSGLEGGFGRIHCASFVDLGATEVVTFRRDRKPWKGSKPSDDSKLAMSIRDYLEAADIIVSWNGIFFDIPFLNARLIEAGERTIRLGDVTKHVDLKMYTRPPSMRPGRSSLEKVQVWLGLDESKTPLSPSIWADAATGDPAAMDEVVRHCEADVLILREAWPRLAPLVKKVTFTLSQVWHVIDQIPGRTAS
jgi:uncharacterized protein YprB with RNaseH-like and TPR domain